MRTRLAKLTYHDQFLLSNVFNPKTTSSFSYNFKLFIVFQQKYVLNIILMEIKFKKYIIPITGGNKTNHRYVVLFGFDSMLVKLFS